MFTRIMAVVLTVILLLTVALSAIGYMTLRGREINATLAALTAHGREIAWLAAQNRASTAALMLGMDNDMQRALYWKAHQVYADYGAYILVVDRLGRTMDNLYLTQDENPDFAASLNGRELTEAMAKVISGEEIQVRSLVDGAPTFTVGVPFIRDELVLGAVLIQTPARQVEAGAREALPRVLLVALGMSVAAGLVLFFMLRRLLRPLRQVSEAASVMAGGDFTVRVDTSHAAPELREMASAFNGMADQLATVEQGRREFVANVSHELKSPITAIGGFVQGMQDGTIPPEEHTRYLAIVGDETRRLTKLIGDLLALSRLESDDAVLNETDFDICELLRRAIIRRVNELERKRMDVVCDFQEEPCMVRADMDRIDQVALNLLDNAIRFTPEGGRVTLTTQAAGSLQQITVADNGIGILPEDRPHIFERFFTADRAHTAGTGTGLGLSICDRIMKMHGQSITLLDTERGAAFRLTLPRADLKGKALPAGGGEAQ